MQFKCNSSADELDYYQTVGLSNLDILTPSSFIELIIGTIGLVNNCILLIVAYRIGWFRHYQFYFVLNQSIVDLLTALGMIAMAARTLAMKYSQTSDIVRLFDCLLIFMPLEILYYCSKRSALTVAIDRFLSIMFPLKWMRLEAKYRYSLIAISWIWAIAQEMGYLFFTPHDVCVTVCFCCQNFSVSVAWDTLVRVCDGTIGILTIVLYLLTPAMAKNMCRRVVSQQKHTVVYCTTMERQERQMAKRVRAVSYVTLITYFCTMSASFLTMEILAVYHYATASDTLLLIMSLAMAWMLVNTVPSLYLYAWKDMAFRNMLKSMAREFIAFFGLQRSYGSENRTEEQTNVKEYERY